MREKNIVVIDVTADGNLDKIEKGTKKDLSQYQKYYNEILMKGIQSGKVKEEDGKYKVI